MIAFVAVLGTPTSSMLISTIFMWVAIAAGFIIALPSLWLCSHALWPEAAERRAQIASTGQGRSFLLGLIPFFIAALLTARLGKLGLAGVIPLGALLLWGFVSADGLATTIGRRVWPYLANDRPWKQTMRGGMVLVGTALLPLVGWVLVLPLLLIIGWGTSLRARTSKTPPPLPAPATEV